MDPIYTTHFDREPHDFSSTGVFCPHSLKLMHKFRKPFQTTDDTYHIDSDFCKQGANGITLKATAQKTGKTVIIKMPKLKGVGSQDMSQRIETLNTFLGIEGRILPKLRGLKSVAQLIDQGLHDHKGIKGNSVRFNVYEFIPGVHLQEWADLYAKSHKIKVFQGIREIDIWLKIALDLVGILTDMHSRKVVHGDLWQENIFVRDIKPASFARSADVKLALIDFGWGIDLDQRSSLRANRNIWVSHWAPERVKYDNSNPRWYSPVDIYSLGNTFLFLAAGKCEIIPFLEKLVEKEPGRKNAYKINVANNSKFFKSDIEIKAKIADAIAKNNPTLYEAFPAITELIMYCMRPDVERRAKHAGMVERQLKALIPNKAAERRFLIPEFKKSAKSLNDIVSKSCSSRTHPILLRLVQNDLEKMAHGFGQKRMMLMERQGERDDLILDLTSCIGEAKTGDRIKAVLALRLLQKNNLGPAGRFIASLANASKSGVAIGIVVLAKKPDDKSTDFRLLMSDLKKRKINVKVQIYDEREYETFAREHGSFLIITTPQGVVVMDADFERSGGRCTALRFSSRTKRSTDVLIYNDFFNATYKSGKPILKNPVFPEPGLKV